MGDPGKEGPLPPTRSSATAEAEKAEKGTVANVFKRYFGKSKTRDLNRSQHRRNVSSRDEEAIVDHREKFTSLPSVIVSTRTCSWFGRKSDNSKKLDTDEVKKKRWRSLPFVGFVLFILGAISYLSDPVELLHDWSMRVGPDSRYLHIWKQPPINIYTKVYIFNFSNPEAFLAGKENKLRLQELGPFVFKETLRNTKVRFNSNGTMTYTPRRSVEFVRHLSVADPKKLHVVVPNIALLGLGSMMADASVLTNFGLLSTIKYIGSKPFLNMTAHDYLWGYDDPLVEIAHTLVANWIPFAKLGLLDRMYDEGDNEVTVRLQDNGLPVTDPGYLPQYSIDTYNGSPGLSAWGYQEEEFYDREDPLRPQKTERCKLIRGGTEGVLFPRHLNPNMTSYIYRKPFCRIMPVEFKKEGSWMPGIRGHWYGLPDNVFDTPENNPDQRCYCNPDYDNCLPKGLSDITPCYYNIPAAVSFPHFYNGDPALLEAIDGLSPSKEKHGAFAVLQPELGCMLDFTTRIQTNLVMKNIRYNSELVPLANLHIPFFWVELTTDGLPTDMVVSLYGILVIFPALQTATIILGAISGVCLMAASMYYLYQRCIVRRDSLQITSKVIQTLETPITPKLVTLPG